MGVNSLPKTVTRQRCGYDLNPGPSAPESSTLTIRLPSHLEKEIVQGTTADARRRRRPCTAWIDNFKTWTKLSVEESIRITEERDKWRKYVHGLVANPRIEEG